MTQTTIIRRRGKLYTFSFTEGVKPVEPTFRKDDDAIQAECIRLARQGKHEEAEELLERYCSSR